MHYACEPDQEHGMLWFGFNGLRDMPCESTTSKLENTQL